MQHPKKINEKLPVKTTGGERKEQCATDQKRKSKKCTVIKVQLLDINCK